MPDNEPCGDFARPLHVTVVAWQSLPAILTDSARNVGGLELAAWKWSKALAVHSDMDVRIIARSDWRNEERTIDDVRVSMIAHRRENVRRSVSACIQIDNGVRLKRFSPKLLWQIPYLALSWPWRTPDPEPLSPDDRLRKYPTDVWIALGASRESAGVVATAIEQNKPSLLLLQSNNDVDPTFISSPQQRSAYGELGEHCVYALRNATVIACQTKHQQEMLAKHFGRESVLLPNSTDPGPWRDAARTEGDYVLWVGRYDRFHKRPHLALEIARLVPEVPFRMIINESDEQVRREVHKNLPANVQTTDYVAFDKMPEQFGRARVFLSTGNAQYEGFPAVLLHAMSVRKPIVSLDDFSGFISDSRSGTVADGSVEKAAAAIRDYWNGGANYDHQFASDFLDQNHSINAVGQQLADLIRQMVADSKAAVSTNK
ncbi:glycosyltransferase family 4 protein [Planctomycetes bacterium K23_9]|uniref:Glycosyl transferases group 1 n=1 Tax=Stieleria marina TaxID=1930275 RepID=A0A517NPK4_9BACT|nr:Glycosyl transferases group 1 [Planctomycetes bacterium K23_9]